MNNSTRTKSMESTVLVNGDAHDEGTARSTATTSPPPLAYPDVRTKSSAQTIVTPTDNNNHHLPVRSDSAVAEHLAHAESQLEEYVRERNLLLDVLRGSRGLLSSLLEDPEAREHFLYCARAYRDVDGTAAFLQRRPASVMVKGDASLSSTSDMVKGDASSPDTDKLRRSISPASSVASTTSALPSIFDPAVNYRLLHIHDHKLSRRSVDSNSGTMTMPHPPPLGHHAHVHLLLQKLQDCARHVDKLTTRVADTRSKVLITGDLNAGKSTLINALLRREILPHDQQPCTAAFCEVMDADVGNAGVEEVHAVVDPALYDPEHEETFTRFPLEQLVQAHAENRHYQLWKVFVSGHANAPTSNATKTRAHVPPSLLHNNVVDLTLIDSPGLNRDLSQTMAVFAQHEEIDAVIFVVNAENHFTLSGADFIIEARNEKPLMMVVVNRFDSIVDRDRCVADVRHQLASLLPQTLAEEKELLHFVSARSYLRDIIEEGNGGLPDFKKHQSKQQQSEHDDSRGLAFLDMEASLRSFLVDKRLQSKLAPAANYLDALLSDVEQLASVQIALAQREMDAASAALNTNSPVLTRLAQLNDTFGEEVDNALATTSQTVYYQMKHRMEMLLAEMPTTVASVSYPGLFQCRAYAYRIIDTARQQLLETMLACQDSAIVETQQTIERLHCVADKATVPHLMSAASLVDPVPSAIRRPVEDLVPVANAAVHVDLELSDFIAWPSHYYSMSSMIIAGSLSTIGGSVVGFQRLGSGITQVGQWMGLTSVKRIALTSVTVLGLGTAALIVTDMQRTITRSLTRKIKHKIRTAPALTRDLNTVVYHSRRQLESSSFQLKKTAATALERTQVKCGEQTRRLEDSKMVRNHFQSVQSRTRGLMEVLETSGVRRQGVIMAADSTAATVRE